MNQETSRSEVVRYWWTKAQECLDSAHREMESGSHGFAMNRIYYAAFYAVSAALLERQATFKKHSGVRAAFHHEFIRKSFLEIEWGKFYDQLFEDRQEGDYLAMIEFDLEYVQDKLNRCKQFLSLLKPMIPSPM